MKPIGPYITLSIIISGFIMISGGMGMARPEIYEAEVYDWQVQAVWQDYIDVILIVPVLVISGISTRYKSKAGGYIWAGTLIYLIYTYTIFCFDVHFNQLFLFYCLILGLSFYSLAWFLYENFKNSSHTEPVTTAIPVYTAGYFIILGCSFYLLWLFDIVPSLISKTLPRNVEKYELLTNPVHVIDLAIILPAFIITGIMIYSKKGPWRQMMFLMLVFGSLMSFTIGSLQLVMYLAKLTSSLAISGVMFVLGLADIILFKASINKYELTGPKESMQILNFN